MNNGPDRTEEEETDKGKEYATETDERVKMGRIPNPLNQALLTEPVKTSCICVAVLLLGDGEGFKGKECKNLDNQSRPHQLIL